MLQSTHSESLRELLELLSAQLSFTRMLWFKSLLGCWWIRLAQGCYWLHLQYLEGLQRCPSATAIAPTAASAAATATTSVTTAAIARVSAVGSAAADYTATATIYSCGITSAG